MWNSAHATTSKVEDSAGDTFTELLHFAASDGTEMSVWSAPITSGAGTRPTITATPTSAADVGVAALEYSGLSNAAGTAVLDQSAQASGKTTTAGVVSTSPTPPTTAPNELVMGFYEDSGFGDTLMAKMGFNERVNVSPNGDMEFVVEDSITRRDGVHSVIRGADGSSDRLADGDGRVQVGGHDAQAISAPLSAPANVLAFPGSGSATVTWSSARNGGSQITRYRITPYARQSRAPRSTPQGTRPWSRASGTGSATASAWTPSTRWEADPNRSSQTAAVPESWLVSFGWCSPLLSPYV